jgi:flagellar biosynthesis/type III secretory pathway protein FliH
MTSRQSALPDAGAIDRPWIVRGDAPVAVLVPRAAPLPTVQDVDDAFRRGYEEGFRLAEAERAHAVVALQAAASAARQDVADLHVRTRATTVTLAVDLAAQLARWLVNTAIAADPDVLRLRVEHALDAIADERAPRVVVATSMVEQVRAWLGSDAIVEGDAALDVGELRIDAGHASLDATYDGALGRARDALIEALDRPGGMASA